MLGSVQDTLMRVRPPRVKITYDVETGGALEKKELPFIVGILAELSGDFQEESQPPLPPLKDRKFVEIDRDNFNDVMKKISPGTSLGKLKNVLADTGGQPSGGQPSGGQPSGGQPSGEQPSGGQPSGGQPSGGQPSGGQPSGGQPSGGLPSGGQPSGGQPSGGQPSDVLLTGALKFESLEDFDPVRVIKQVAPMAALYDGRARLRSLQSKSEITEKLSRYLDLVTSNDGDGKAAHDEFVGMFEAKAGHEGWIKVAPKGLLEKLLGTEGLNLDDGAKQTLMGLLGQFAVDVVASNKDAHPQGTAALIDQRVANVDQALSKQLDVIMHAPGFQRLEATWRGLHYLVSRTETGALLKLRVLNASKKDLLDDLNKAVEFDQSGLFKMIYEAEYGTFGGQPFSMLVGDYEFGRQNDDTTLLDKLAQVAAASHAPFIAAAYAKLFDLESFESLARPRDLQKIFESLELIKWREFRQSEDSRYVSLILPRVLLRLPYGPNTLTCEGVNYKEDVGSRPDAASFLWGNAAFILAQRITNAFAIYGWTAAIRGVEGGGLVEGLPIYTYKSDDGDIAMICPTQVAITDRREKELNDLGFIAICHCKGSGKAAFFGGQSTNQPKKYLSDLANSNAQLSAMLPYMLAASRFAHYIKVIMREKVGAFMTRAGVEAFLNSWIAQYVLLDENAAQDVKASYPLSAAKISVTEVPGKPGSYKATIFIRPHFQLEELTTSIRLVAQLPS